MGCIKLKKGRKMGFICRSDPTFALAVEYLVCEVPLPPISPSWTGDGSSVRSKGFLQAGKPALAGRKAEGLQTRGAGGSVTAQPTHLHLGNTFQLRWDSSHLRLAAKKWGVQSMLAGWVPLIVNEDKGSYSSQIPSNTILRDIWMDISRSVQVTGASRFYLRFSTPGHEIIIRHSEKRNEDCVCSKLPGHEQQRTETSVLHISILWLITGKIHTIKKDIIMTKLYKVQTGVVNSELTLNWE